MCETPRKGSAGHVTDHIQHPDVTLVGKFTDPTKYYVLTVVLPLLLILFCHFAIYWYKGDYSFHLDPVLSKLHSAWSCVTGNVLYAVLLAVAVTTYSCIIVYLNSEVPGIDPPTPIRLNEKRTCTESRMGFSYIMSIAIGFMTFVFALFPNTIVGDH
ncbi:uncharacterized protein LOC135368248 [Ornithodoros turicata]|uniref:uncharacterized protein LOC135368248 n=1 Tax=Ornithodoros turicata TaxID=34597 RepID=UPI003139B04E